MNYSGLAVILLRCSGVISIVVGGLHVLGRLVARGVE
jgi:hypothetical protein